MDYGIFREKMLCRYQIDVDDYFVRVIGETKMIIMPQVRDSILMCVDELNSLGEVLKMCSMMGLKTIEGLEYNFRDNIVEVLNDSLFESSSIEDNYNIINSTLERVKKSLLDCLYEESLEFDEFSIFKYLENITLKDEILILFSKKMDLIEEINDKVYLEFEEYTTKGIDVITILEECFRDYSKELIDFLCFDSIFQDITTNEKINLYRNIEDLEKEDSRLVLKGEWLEYLKVKLDGKEKEKERIRQMLQKQKRMMTQTYDRLPEM